MHVKGQEQVFETIDVVCEWFRSFESCIVAFSAGVDSSLLAYCARKTLGQNAFAVTSLSPSFSKSEMENALLMSREIGIQLISVTQNDLGTRGYVDNGVNRCYYCRNNLAAEILRVAEIKSVSVCVDGTHVDDMRVPRPGIKALREAGFRAPFVELSVGKEAIRLAARSVGLSNWNRPSEACLSSRVAFGQSIDLETLQRIEAAERIVKLLTNAEIVRVRTIGKKASVEVDKPSLPTIISKGPSIARALIELGYSEVEIDPSGYSPGKMLELFVKENL
jgi:uncharacterized protein